MSEGDLIKSRENAEWVVDGFGAQGALLMIAADVGTGKTTLLYAMATAIGKRKPFLLNAEGIGQLKIHKKCYSFKPMNLRTTVGVNVKYRFQR